MVSFRQRQTVLDYVRIGREEARHVVVGGGIPTEPELAQGAYIQPTVLDRVTSPGCASPRRRSSVPSWSSSPSTPKRSGKAGNDTPYGPLRLDLDA